MSGSNPVVPLGSPPPSANEFQIHTRLPLVRFLSRAVQPPSQVYVTESDDIVVGCASSVANETVTVSYRLLRADGELVLGQFQLHPAADRSLAIHQESLAEGFLLSVSCKAAAATSRGQTFVRVFLTDPALGGGQPSYMLMADYVTTAMAPAHPNGRVLAPSEGPGNIYGIVAGAVPPGVDIGLTVPVNARWRPIGFLATLQCGAAVVNRIPEIVIISSAHTMWRAPGNQQFPAGTLGGFIAGGVSQPSTLDPVTSNAAFPPETRIVAGGSIQTFTISLQPADQWLSAQVVVEEWLDNV